MMTGNRVLLLVALLVAAAVAESIRETETMDPNVMLEDLVESSGSLPDDEDFDDSNYYDGLDSSVYDENSFDEISGSGDWEEEDDLESTVETLTTTMGNKIPEKDFNEPERDIDNNVFQIDNDIMMNKKKLETKLESNEISMASTAHSFFSRTEVVVAVVAGCLVGLLFAIFIIVFLVKRNSNKDVAYDTVKKPIYKKAPTIEV